MKPNYFNRSLFFLIPVVAISIVAIYLISYKVPITGNYPKYIIHAIIITAGLWTGCMAIVIFLWKKFPWEHKPIRHLLLEILLILSYTIAFSSLLYLLEKKLWNFNHIENIGMEIFITILITFFITSIHESIFFYSQWKYNFSKSVRLEKDNIEARFEALRAQINPHFLFNSLNSLANMAGENKTVVDYVKNLSELLRYMLKSSEKEVVLVRDEIAILNNYISLQQLRFRDTVHIIVDVPESFYHFAVPPLVLQMLVENCFKHNIISKEKPLKVEIKADKESITVRNNLKKKEGANSTGQGLNNIIGRYRFFTTRTVEVIETLDEFVVTIPLLQVEL